MTENVDLPEPVAVTLPVPAVAAPTEAATAPEKTPPEPPNPSLAPEDVSLPAPTPAVVPVAEAPVEAAADEEEASPEPEEPRPVQNNKRWYVVKIQSGREDTIKEAIERRVKIEGLEEYFGQIVIPVETVIEMKNNKRVKKSHKLYPGYLFVEVEYNDRMLYLFRETSGVGDFVGHTIVNGEDKKPTPMPPHEVERMLRKTMPAKEGEPEPPIKITAPKFDKGDRLRVTDGTFVGMEGEVVEIIEAKGLVKLTLHIFGRPVSVDLEYWQVERA